MKSQATIQSDYVDVPEVASTYHVSTALVSKLIKQGQIPHIRLGRLVRVPRSALASGWNVEQR
jgi:excisionase family DNA binding protein